MNPAAPSIRQHGFTLIECMIAMTLGMLIIAAATALLLTAQQTYFAIDGNARIDDAAATALAALGGAIRQAAYADHGSATSSPRPPFNALFERDTGSMPKHAVKDSDFLATRFMATDSKGKPDANMRNCAGNTLKSHASPVNQDTVYNWSVFYIGSGDSRVPELYCRYLSDKKNFTGDAIASGVESMKFMYGVDRNGDGLPETFLQAQAMVRADWAEVTAVGITLSIRGTASARRIVRSTVMTHNGRDGRHGTEPHWGN